MYNDTTNKLFVLGNKCSTKLGLSPNTISKDGRKKSARLELQSFSLSLTHTSHYMASGTIKIFRDSLMVAVHIIFSGVDKEFHLFIATTTPN